MPQYPITGGKCENLIHLDCASLFRDGLSARHEANGDLLVRARGVGSYTARAIDLIGGVADKVELTYKLDCWREMGTQRIRLSWCPNMLLGKIAHWLCPLCQKRVRRLYLLGQQLQCHDCAGFRYASEPKARNQRAIYRLRQIRRRIGATDDIGDPMPSAPPPGMNRAPFERLLEEALRLEAKLKSSRRRSVYFPTDVSI